MTDSESISSGTNSLERRSKERRLSDSSSHDEHMRLACIVKGVHADLRKKFKSSGENNLERIWDEHCQNKPVLSQYADAMHHLATEHWTKNQETRIDWCRETINEYFTKGGLEKVLDKEERRKQHKKDKQSSGVDNGKSEINDSNLLPEKSKENANLLDVMKVTSKTVQADGSPGSEITDSSNLEPKSLTDMSSESSSIQSSGAVYLTDSESNVNVSSDEGGDARNIDSSCSSSLHKPMVSSSEDDTLQFEERQMVFPQCIGASGVKTTDPNTPLKHSCSTVILPVEGKIRLLDVGSCFNPFLTIPEFQAVGIDISPATESVFYCDFLHLRTTEPLQVADDTMSTFINNLKDPVDWLPEESFHVIVFSLLLEYFPAPYQRWLCCEKAWNLLMYNGILVIVTPDSHKQHRNAPMVKSWKTAIESLGFKRWRYVKQEHLHCMVFRKVTITSEDKQQRFLKGITPDMIYIPQDFNDVENFESVNTDYGYCEQNEEFYRSHAFNELPTMTSESDEN